jgi:outer membrane protein
MLEITVIGVIMKFFFTLIISLLITSNSYGVVSLAKLTQELLSQNNEILSAQASYENSKLDVELHNAEKNWGLEYDLGYNDSKLKSSIFYAAAPTETTNHSLSLSKNTYHGGQFSLSNTLSIVKGTNLFTKIFSDISGFSQTAAYSLDLGANFFGRQARAEKKILQETEMLEKNESDKINDQQILSLALGFTQARLAMAMEELDSEALSRAKKREQLIRKRVSDGLKLKVDLYQAEMSTKAQVEAFSSSGIFKDSSYETMGKLLHREVGQADVLGFNFDNIERKMPNATELTKNNSLEIIKEKLKIIDTRVAKANFGTLPSISLSTAYISNGYNSEVSKAFSEGALGSNSNAFQIGLNLVWSIGSEPANLKKSQYMVSRKLLAKQKENLEKNLALTESILRKRIAILNKNLESVKLRKVLARKALTEYNKLYNRGRADLDSVIRAEESLILTEKTFVSYLAERDKASYQIAYLYGDLQNYVEHY